MLYFRVKIIELKVYFMIKYLVFCEIYWIFIFKMVSKIVYYRVLFFFYMFMFVIEGYSLLLYCLVFEREVSFEFIVLLFLFWEEWS